MATVKIRHSVTESVPDYRNFQTAMEIEIGMDEFEQDDLPRLVEKVRRAVEGAANTTLERSYGLTPRFTAPEDLFTLWRWWTAQAFVIFPSTTGPAKYPGSWSQVTTQLHSLAYVREQADHLIDWHEENNAWLLIMPETAEQFVQETWAGQGPWYRLWVVNAPPTTDPDTYYIGFALALIAEDLAGQLPGDVEDLLAGISRGYSPLARAVLTREMATEVGTTMLQGAQHAALFTLANRDDIPGFQAAYEDFWSRAKVEGRDQEEDPSFPAQMGIPDEGDDDEGV